MKRVHAYDPAEYDPTLDEDENEAGYTVWSAEEWFPDPPAALVKYPDMSDEEFEKLIGIETGIANTSRVRVTGMREYLRKFRSE